MSRGYSSNSKMFAKRGDPWISRKEGIKDFGRNPDTEDAEYDFDHRFHHSGDVIGKPRVAEARPEYRDPIPERSNEVDWQRKKANILRTMHSNMNKERSHRKIAEASRRFVACPGCRLAECFAARGGLGLCKHPFGR